MKIDLISGQKNFKNMTSKLNEQGHVNYKAQFWLLMLNDGMRPTKWLKPNVKGTKVNFDFMKGQEEYDQALKELEVFLYEINKKYGFDYKLNRE